MGPKVAALVLLGALAPACKVPPLTTIALGEPPDECSTFRPTAPPCNETGPRPMEPVYAESRCPSPSPCRLPRYVSVPVRRSGESPSSPACGPGTVDCGELRSPQVFDRPGGRFLTPTDRVEVAPSRTESRYVYSTDSPLKR